MNRLLSEFERLYGRRPVFVARAPGRVNMIGEHTDYNDGFVLPAAIERETRIALAPRDDDQVRLVALDLGRETVFNLHQIATSAEQPWSNYVRGVAHGLKEHGYPLRGADMLVHGTVPIGSGLSSSAALEMASVQAFAAAGDFTLPPEEAARIGQAAEHMFVGANTGLMDQLASALGQAGHLLLIDIRSLVYQPVPVPGSAAILIADTAVRRSLASSAYNERRSQCEQAAQAMGVPALRDATMDLLSAVDVPDVVRRRATHVIQEDERVLQAVEAFRAGDLAFAGQLMNASHFSLRDLYEVSSPELDVMAELLRSQGGCYGARLTGAGFGGCCVALMESQAVEAAIPAVAQAYESDTGLKPALYPTRAAGGANTIRL
ncbi:MAG: galactokinase [Nitrososphaerales archaeon]